MSQLWSNWYKETPDGGIARCESVEEINQATDNRQVAATRFKGGGLISTVFLSLDHGLDGGPPLVYETMSFDIPSMEDEQERYSSRSEAIEGHQRFVERARALGLAEESE